MTDSKQPATKKFRSDSNDKEDAEMLQAKTKIESSKKSDLLREADEALQESNKRHVKPVVDETKLGIELFVGDTKDQYHGLIKTRYCDFIVHEIDLDGQPAHLTDLEPPEEEEPSCSMKLEDFLDRKALICMSNVNSGLLDSYRIDVTNMDKDLRTSLHYAIRESYDKLESTTVSDSDKPKSVANGNNQADSNSKIPDSTQQVDEEKSKTENKDNGESGQSEEKRYIVVTRRNKSHKRRNFWPRNRPDYLHFILYKENKDTMDAIQNLACTTNNKSSNFSYAGTKDRRAVTTQWVSCWRLDPKRLATSLRRFNKRPFIKAGNFCFKKDPVKLGQLRANHFDIVIRHLVHNSEGVKVIKEAMNSIKEKGFINYFGLQRFGTRSVQTQEVGLAILQGDWEKAVDLVLSYRYDDTTQAPQNPESSPAEENNGADIQKVQQRPNKRWTSAAEQHNACIDIWKSKQDAELIFKRYPHFRNTNEGQLIKSLSKSREQQPSHDYASALTSLPRNIRSMYVHSYQSLLWNKLATFRLKKYGFQVVPGDLILCPDSDISDNSLDILLTTDEPEVSSSVDATVEEEKPSDSTKPNKSFLDDIDSKITIANEENLDKYTIFDVVLPLIGSRAKLPTNEVRAELERLLKDVGVTLESFKAREKMFVSYGSYRKIMVRPKNLEWTIKQYSHPHENLVETDLDRLNREHVGNKDKSRAETDQQRSSSPAKSDLSDEALIVSFELPPSCYATICLREMMKKPSTDFNNRF